MVLYKLQFLYRKWQHKQYAQKTALANLYQQRPLSGKSTVKSNRFLVLDCEMSGLDPKKAQLLSIGWILIEQGKIINNSARHILVHAESGAGESTKVHGLFDAEIAGAKSVASALMSLIKLIPDSILVFHHAPIDIQFLQTAARDIFRTPLLFSYMDTLAIEQSRMALQGKQKSLRLPECRKRYGLPPSQEHNALTDAIATAELFLAQIHYLTNSTNPKLNQLPLESS